jgi:hypothetical protein
VNDNEQFTCKGGTHRHMTFFCARMVWIGNRQREWIAENGRRFFEADAMLGKISIELFADPIRTLTA